VPGLVAALVDRTAADVVTKLPPGRQYEDALRAVRALAVAVCPDLPGHPEVQRYCLRPVALEPLAPGIQKELMDFLPRGWADS